MAEKKQEIFIDILTQYLSNWWSTIGMLKTDINSLPKQFKNTKELINILENLLDAYAVAIANTESLLEENFDINFDDKIEKNR